MRDADHGLLRLWGLYPPLSTKNALNESVQNDMAAIQSSLSNVSMQDV